jgi:Brp/Blh family beta-carotene 15,15'-monooxygenase
MEKLKMVLQNVTLRHKILVLGLIITLFCLTVHLSVNTQLALLTVILLVTGIPHGSLDYYLEEERFSKSQKKINRALFFAKYILQMLFYAVLWIFFPNLSLFVFICITAYHFGEIDWVLKNNKWLNSMLLFVYGLLMILFMITIHIHATAHLIYVLVKQRFSMEQIIATGIDLTLYCKIGFLLIIMLTFIIRKKINWTLADICVFSLQTLLLYAICTILPFYLSFTFYFGIWHSALSFDIIRKQLNFANTGQGWKKMIKKCLPFVTIAFFILCFFSFSKYSFFFSSTVITNLIIGVAVMTLPHLQVFSRAIRTTSLINRRDNLT